jgi:hypothetical protein
MNFRRNEVIGGACGLLCCPHVFFVALFPTEPMSIVLPMAISGTLAGALACSITPTGEAEPNSDSAPQAGIRAGLIATLVTGALTVFAATLRTLGIGHSTESAGWPSHLSVLFPASLPFQVLIIALLGIPPAACFSAGGAIVTTMLRLPIEASHIGGATPFKLPKPVQSRLFIAVIALSAIGYMSPFFLLLRPRPLQLAPAPAAAQRPPTQAPKWRYQYASEFDTAAAARITLTERRSLGEIEGGLPVAMSPDGRRFAYWRRSSSLALEICDLDTLDIVGRVEPDQEPAALSWSPDGKRLLINVQGGSGLLQVFDLERFRLMKLPLPKATRIPQGRPQWFDLQEVFFPGSGIPQVLNLDTLRMQRLDDSAKWNALPKGRQEEIRRGAAPSPNLRRQLSFRMAVRRYDVPVDASADWPLGQSLQLAVSDSKEAYSSVQLQVDVNVGDLILAASDGTKLVRIRNGEASVFYFGLRTETPNRFRIRMPGPPDSSLAALLSKKSVCAFICAPLVNPLNGRTVGPDRESVKALARFASWNGVDADLRIEEDYLPVRRGDVVADIHTWQEGRPHPAGDLGKREWFEVLDKIEADAPLLRSEARLLDREPAGFGLDPDGSGRVSRIANAQPPPPQPGPSPLQSQQGLPIGSRPPAPISDVEEALRSFLAAHHLKSTQGDVSGLVADYGDLVDHFSNGIVDREFIRKDESEYHSPGTRVSESIIARPEFAPLGSNCYSAKYSISFHRVRPDGRWVKGNSDIDLQIEMTPAGPRIIRQRAKPRDQQKGP